MTAGAYHPIRNVRKQLHINLQFSNFLGGGPPNPPPPQFFICHPSPELFFYKNGYTLKSLLGTPLDRMLHVRLHTIPFQI